MNTTTSNENNEIDNKKVNIKKIDRKIRLICMESLLITISVCALLLPSYTPFEKTGVNLYEVWLNDVRMGTVTDMDRLDLLFNEARKQTVYHNGTDNLTLMDLKLSTKPMEVLWAKASSDGELLENMQAVMESSIMETLHRSYTVKINETAVNLGSIEDVDRLLEYAIEPYDKENKYDIRLVLDNDREVNVLKANVAPKDESEAMAVHESVGSAGIEKELDSIFGSIEPAYEKTFEDYENGLVNVGFADKIEVVEAYLLEDEIQTVDEAADRVTKEQETQVIYKVAAGDTLSQICMDNNIPMEELIAINDALKDENTMIRVDQELVITVPEPDLSILWTDEKVLVEDYEAEVQYIYNDDWYTTQTKTLQEPSAGRRKVAVAISYRNNEETGREILKEEVYAEAVPKIVEKGTKIPPTYIKPIYGGRMSSGFGARSAPTKGASTYHKGIDWAVPIGTAVVASNAGTVTQAGWASGYGYAVYIRHDDGRETRYGHLSKVLVKAGQRVSQNQRIALSGNSGRSTGPHLHFEIRINGAAVNPLKYLN